MCIRDRFWNARKCLRFNPIQPDENGDLLPGLDEFVLKKLKIPAGLLSKDDIKFVRKVKPTRRSKVKDEVLVAFTTVEARDLVQSYARNLGEWVGQDGKSTAGLRMEVPERLIGEFKIFEQYGFAMKEKHGNGFKRNIKIDDSKMGLYMDVFYQAPKSGFAWTLTWLKRTTNTELQRNLSRRTKIFFGRRTRLKTATNRTTTQAERNFEIKTKMLKALR